MNSELTKLVDRLIESARGLGFHSVLVTPEQRTPEQQRDVETRIRWVEQDRAALATYLDAERPSIGAEELHAIEARANAATPGPWGWWGEWDMNDFSLCTTHGGRKFVMGFRRAGMNSAQPEFLDDKGHLHAAKDLAIFQVAPKALSRHNSGHNVYRGTVIGFRSPDAEFIAHARADIETLLARIRELENSSE